MATFYPVGGGAPGIDPNTLTSTAGDILYPTIGGVSGNYNGVQGTLQLTGNAQLNHVLSGETFYTTNAKSKQTGTMTVQSILSFSCAPYSASQIVFTWQNPHSGPFSGVIIIGKTGGYPANINDGTRYYKGYGNNASSNGVSGVVIGGFNSGTTYYFRAFSYVTLNNEEWTIDTNKISNTIINIITQVITSSTTWTVPSNVNSVKVFIVGGGGGGSLVGLTYGGSGGGGGYTATQDISVSPNQQISIIIGSGGNGRSTPSIGDGGDGYPTSFGSFSISGGHGGAVGGGGNGGSGGGGGANWYYNSSYYTQTWGGSGGSNGSDSGVQLATGQGIGQHYTTRAFGESSGTIFSGGGGGGSRGGNGNQDGGAGGADGGGNGGSFNIIPTKNGQSGIPNSGGGGGGNGAYEDGDNKYYTNSGNGGSGICIIRYIS